MARPEPVVTIKLYANQRLYDARAGCDVTREDLTAMAKTHTRFVDDDAEARDDVTPSVTPIIVEH